MKFRCFLGSNFAGAILLVPHVIAQTCPATRFPSPWSLFSIKSLVTFGDSYTDETRLAYFITHNGSAPPPAYFEENPDYRPWPRYVTRYSERLKLYNYAVAGAVCSNKITPRPFPELNTDFPSVLEYEIPTFLADVAAGHHAQPLTPDSTVYALFIGTNDLGSTAFVTDSQLPGKVLADYTSCVFDALSTLYAFGARNFLLLNVAPLHLLPQYANETLGGAERSRFFPDKEGNLTRVSEKMRQATTSVNEILKYRVPYEVVVSRILRGANVALFDTWSLFSDIYHSPERYLNGSKPADVRGWINHCGVDWQGCWDMWNGTSNDSFMWVDELHPSEQVHRVMAKEIVQTLGGRSAYATYWSG